MTAPRILATPPHRAEIDSLTKGFFSEYSKAGSEKEKDNHCFKNSYCAFGLVTMFNCERSMNILLCEAKTVSQIDSSRFESGRFESGRYRLLHLRACWCSRSSHSLLIRKSSIISVKYRHAFNALGRNVIDGTGCHRDSSEWAKAVEESAHLTYDEVLRAPAPIEQDYAGTLL